MMHEYGVPDGIEPILGCRVWQVNRKERSIESIAYPVPWTPWQPLRGVCLAGRVSRWLSRKKHGEVPAATCHCGVWALSEPVRLSQIAYRPSLLPGVVKAWGRVVVGTRGWRAEFAYPAAFLRPFRSWAPGLLSEPPLDDDLLRVLAERYGVPILDSWPDLSLPGEAWWADEGSPTEAA